MKSHELARKLLALPDCEVMLDAYESRLNLLNSEPMLTEVRKFKRRTNYRGDYTDDECDLDPDCDPDEYLEPEVIPAIRLTLRSS